MINILCLNGFHCSCTSGLKKETIHIYNIIKEKIQNLRRILFRILKTFYPKKVLNK